MDALYRQNDSKRTGIPRTACLSDPDLDHKPLPLSPNEVVKPMQRKTKLCVCGDRVHHRDFFPATVLISLPACEGGDKQDCDDQPWRKPVRKIALRVRERRCMLPFLSSVTVRIMNVPSGGGRIGGRSDRADRANSFQRTKLS